MKEKDEIYCTVVYPITITKQGLLSYGDLTEKQYNNLTEYEKQNLILDLADHYLENGSVKPLITECIDKELND